MVKESRTGASMFDVVTRPQCGEALASDAEFADELDKFVIGSLRAEHSSQKRDQPARELFPVTVEHAYFGLEKRCAQDIFARCEKARQRAGHMVGRQDRHVLVDNERRCERPTVDKCLHGWVESFGDRAATPMWSRAR
jgi:hypothetical protein